jgi:hypothetical protein
VLKRSFSFFVHTGARLDAVVTRVAYGKAYTRPVVLNKVLEVATDRLYQVSFSQSTCSSDSAQRNLNEPPNRPDLGTFAREHFCGSRPLWTLRSAVQRKHTSRKQSKKGVGQESKRNCKLRKCGKNGIIFSLTEDEDRRRRPATNISTTTVCLFTTPSIHARDILK